MGQQIASVEPFVVPASGMIRIARTGMFFRLVATQAPMDIVATHQGQKAVFRNVEQGFAVEGMRFSELRVESAAQTFSIAIADDANVKMQDSRPLFSGTFNATLEPADVMIAQPDVSVGDGAGAILIAGANADRKSAILTVPLSAPSGVRIGGAGMSAGEGAILEVGSTMIIDNEGAIYGRVDTGAGAVMVNVSEQRRP